MRVGSLRGSDYLPQGWEEGRDINTTNSLIRYLGIFLGTPEGVARKWEETVTAKLRKRYERWLGRGIPRSRRGRNIVIRNHVQACAWYLVQAQTPPNLPQMLDQWQQYAWRFFEAPANAEGLQQARRHAVKRGTLRRAEARKAAFAPVGRLCPSQHGVPRCSRVPGDSAITHTPTRGTTSNVTRPREGDRGWGAHNRWGAFRPFVE